MKSYWWIVCPILALVLLAMLVAGELHFLRVAFDRFGFWPCFAVSWAVAGFGMTLALLPSERQCEKQ
ncbi:hypothetical protein [Burkholderia stabilis]|uniref:hypothetical protein n=1 Tax=Burkholderia stabilis TaxID=95485 RepID=UPI001F4B2EA0|nr:hypothetical protein [Burkholderia stabilis]